MAKGTTNADLLRMFSDALRQANSYHSSNAAGLVAEFACLVEALAYARLLPPIGPDPLGGDVVVMLKVRLQLLREELAAAVAYGGR